MTFLRSFRVIAGFIAACALLAVFEYSERFVQAAVDAGVTYQRLLTAGYKSWAPQHVALILIRSTIEPRGVTFVNVCQQRLFISRVLELFPAQKVNPSVVVIDKHLAPDSCPNDPASTAALQHAVQAVLDANIPVVVTVGEDEDGRTLPTLTFPAGSNGRTVIEASPTFDEDTNLAALRWDDVKDAQGQTISRDTVSYAASLASRPNLKRDEPRVGQFYDQDFAPFMVFFPSNALDTYTFSPLQLLCGQAATKATDWKTCGTPGTALLNNLSSRVVLIGEDEPGLDEHVTVVGTKPGVWVHANYVEAIMRGDLFKPLHTAVTILYGFAVFVLAEWVLKTSHSFRNVARAVAIMAGAYVICFLVLTFFGYYLNPGLGLVAFLFAEASDFVREKLL